MSGQRKYSIDKENMVCVCVCVYIYAPRKKKILPFAKTWMGLEGIMLSIISQRKTNVVSFHLNVESEKPNLDFSGSSVVKNLSVNAADMGSILGPGRSHTPWGN